MRTVGGFVRVPRHRHHRQNEQVQVLLPAVKKQQSTTCSKHTTSCLPQIHSTASRHLVTPLDIKSSLAIQTSQEMNLTSSSTEYSCTRALQLLAVIALFDFLSVKK